MEHFAVLLGFTSFLLLAATGQTLTFSFAAGVAVLVIVSGIRLQETRKKKPKPTKKKPRKPTSAKPKSKTRRK
ncbi:hypothetical protein ACFLQ2_01730 [archaeon]